MNAGNSDPALRGASPLPTIAASYLLVVNIPLYRHDVAGLCADRLWFKDLAAHLGYLDDFALACPLADGVPADGAVPLTSDCRFAEVSIIPLFSPRGTLRALASVPLTAYQLWRAIRAADLIHTGVAGWPIPYGWIATPIARLLRKKLIIVVESAPWRLAPGLPSGMKARAREWLYESMARWCVGQSDLAIFTHEQYRETLLARKSASGHVIHASWIDAQSIVPESDADAMWDHKLQIGRERISLLFAGRLDARKGVTVLLDAVRLVAVKDIAVTLNILGTGELLSRCRQIAEDLRRNVRVNVLGSVTYGAALFDLLRKYHAVVIPSLSDEQPRIVFDAYSQGVPVLGTRTVGLRDCIKEGVTGWLVEPNNAAAFAAMIERASIEVKSLKRMGMAALASARAMTHQRMHLERQRLLLDLTRGVGNAS